MNNFLATIKKYDMISAGSNVMACVSGGADSMALLSLLCRYKNQLNINNLFAFHLNHGLRGSESNADEKLVVDYCKQNNVVLFVEHADMNSRQKPKGQSVELWARELRYSFFEKYADEHNCLIATAHSQNDRAETLLFQLARGSGLAGAKSIPPVRGRVIRPLIETSREDIEAYCAANKISYAIDSTNLDLTYSRNRIRHTVLPNLKLINDTAVKNLSDFCDKCLEADRFIEGCAEKLLTEAFEASGYNCQKLLSADRAVCSKAVYLLIAKHCSLSNDMIESCVAGLARVKFDLQLNDCKHFVVENGLASVSERAEPLSAFCIPAAVGENVIPGGKTVELLTILEFHENYIDFIKNKSLNDHIDCGKIKGNIYIRSKQDGEKIKTQKSGHTRPVKKIFNELSVPSYERNIYPVLADDEGILWIFGVGVASRAAVDRDTKAAYFIKIKE